MTRIAIILATILIFIGGGVLIGLNWDDARDERAKSDTLERIGDADVGTGDPDDDRSWLSEWLLSAD